MRRLMMTFTRKTGDNTYKSQIDYDALQKLNMSPMEWAEMVDKEISDKEKRSAFVAEQPQHEEQGMTDNRDKGDSAWINPRRRIGVPLNMLEWYDLSDITISVEQAERIVRCGLTALWVPYEWNGNDITAYVEEMRMRQYR